MLNQDHNCLARARPALLGGLGTSVTAGSSGGQGLLVEQPSKIWLAVAEPLSSQGSRFAASLQGMLSSRPSLNCCSSEQQHAHPDEKLWFRLFEVFQGQLTPWVGDGSHLKATAEIDGLFRLRIRMS